MRYHYMDAIRATMMVAGVFFHAGLVYRPGYAWRFRDPSDLFFFTALTDILYSFRMPAFFAVAGFFCALCFERERGIRKLGARLLVFGVPFVVMMFTLQPLQYALKLDFRGSFEGFGTAFWRNYFGEGEYISHLWFLLNLAVYYVAAWIVLMLPGGRDWLRSPRTRRLFRYKTLMSLGACAACLPLIVLLNDLAIGTNYGLHLVVQYAPFFIVGYAIYGNADLFAELKRVQLVDVLVMTLLWMCYYSELAGPIGRLCGLLWFYQCGFVMTGLCVKLFHRFANRENRLMRVVSDSAYTIYLFHHILVVVVAALVAQRLPDAAAPLKYSLVVFAVVVLTIAVHQLIIARAALLKLMFNGRLVRRHAYEPPVPAPSTAASAR